MKSLLKISGKALTALLCAIITALCLFSVSPIYRFEAPRPFAGPDIYNPYAGFDTIPHWKRANFHTHTRVDNILNECPEYPPVVYDDYMKLGYDILAFSNHNQLTRHPYDSTLQINVYEHGFGLFKFHKLVFNPSKMLLFDHPLPFLVSQKQWQYDYLSANADFLVMNHPDRSFFTTPRSMRLLTSYRLMEADSGISTELTHWDEALGAGHYSHCILNDDCHDSGDHRRIAIRSSWLATPSALYEDIRESMLHGRFYSLRTPDFGNGDADLKRAANASLPSVSDIGVRGDTVFVKLTAPARIEATGEGRKMLALAEDGDYLECRLGEDEPYARFTAFFEDGNVLYTNAFARFDKSLASSPYRVSGHSVDVLLTIAYNAMMLALALLFAGFALRLAHVKLKS